MLKHTINTSGVSFALSAPHMSRHTFLDRSVKVTPCLKMVLALSLAPYSTACARQQRSYENAGAYRCAAAARKRYDRISRARFLSNRCSKTRLALTRQPAKPSLPSSSYLKESSQLAVFCSTRCRRHLYFVQQH